MTKLLKRTYAALSKRRPRLTADKRFTKKAQFRESYSNYLMTFKFGNLGNLLNFARVHCILAFNWYDLKAA